jgi:hypothetical protein
MQLGTLSVNDALAVSILDINHIYLSFDWESHVKSKYLILVLFPVNRQTYKPFNKQS